jgi:hypothetical protein
MLKIAGLLSVLLLVSAASARDVGRAQETAESGFAVTTNAALKELRSVDFTSVWRLGFAAADDSPRVIYKSTGSACSLNGGNGDDGAEVRLADGNCAVAVLHGVQLVPQIWGARGNGAANDSTPIQAALATCSRQGGGDVILAATGHAYLLANGVGVPNGCRLIGNSGLYWPSPTDNVEAHWTAAGTWLHCIDMTNPCVTLQGRASDLKRINFWYTQPTPTTTSCAPGNGAHCAYTHNWAPVNYPFAILIAPQADFIDISGVAVANGTNCIDMEGPTNGVAGIWNRLHDLWLTCFKNGLVTRRIDNTIYMSDIRFGSWWFNSSSDVLGYTQGGRNRVDWTLQYVANPQVDGIEFWQSGIAMKFVDDSVTSGFGTLTMAAGSLQMTNVSFNEVCQAMTVENGTTHIEGPSHLTNVIAYADTHTSSSTQCAGAATNGALFNLASDNVLMAFTNINGGPLQELLYAGNGNGGSRIALTGDIAVYAYSAFHTGGHAIVANNADISIPDGGRHIAARVGAGRRLYGPTITVNPPPPTSCAGHASGTIWFNGTSPTCN